MEISETLFTPGFFVLLPVVFAVLLMVTPRPTNAVLARTLGCIFAGLTVWGVAPFWSTTALPLVVTTVLSTQIGLETGFVLDGMSATFVALNGLLIAVGMFLIPQGQQRKFSVFSFLLAAFLNGAFLTSNLVTFFVFYEAVFVPMLVLVGVFGSPGRGAAVFKFLLMSMAGSILMLGGIATLMVGFHEATGQWSAQMAEILPWVTTQTPDQLLLPFIGFALAFAIKVPLFPFHGWLRDVYVLAPMPATLWMSGTLSKLGVYGFLRFVDPMFFQAFASLQFWGLATAAVSIVYGALLAIRSTQPKEILAYSSMSHLGFVMLGIFSMTPEGKSAALFLALAHGLSSGALFYVTGQLQAQGLALDLRQGSGLAQKAPGLSVLLFLATLCSVALPGTANFIGEFKALMASFPKAPLWVAFGGMGVILGAVYSFKLFQSIVFAPLDPMSTVGQQWRGNFRTSGVLAVLVAALIVLGLQPGAFAKGFSLWNS